MLLRSFAVFLLITASAALVHARTDPWVELRTPHFIIVTDSTEKQAHQVAEQLERMRAVFHERFPSAHVDAESPIVVLAMRDPKTFRALEPEAYLAKGAVELAGLFSRLPEKNYVLLRLNAEGKHPYAAVYHEYIHFIFSHSGQWLPVWLNEGLAMFYQTTEIRDKEVELGEPIEEYLRLLRRSRLLPLETLFAVNQGSPYYHEDNKANIFYAESWALTHYLEIRSRHDKVDYISQYVALVNNKVDPVDAASAAFGNLRALEAALHDYLQQPSLQYVTHRVAIKVDPSEFKARTLTPIESDALQADFLVSVQRTKDSRELLDRILKEAPGNAAAHETMGLLAARDGKWQDAATWYEQAAKLDPQNYLDHYLYAQAVMHAGLSAEHAAQVETSLRAAIALHPDFAPALDKLSTFFAHQGKNLDEAYKLELKAVQLEPANVLFRMNGATLLVRMNRPNGALAVLDFATHLTTDPAQLASIQAIAEQIQRYLAQAQPREPLHSASVAQFASAAGASPAAASLPVADSQPIADSDPKHGPRRTAIGTLSDVQCSSPAIMQLKLVDGPSPLLLRARNYYKVAYSALNFTPPGELNPCQDLETKKAKVEYFEGLNGSGEGQVISIEIRK